VVLQSSSQKLRPNDEGMKNLYYKIKPISYWNKLKRTNQLLEQTEKNPSDKKLLNELYATNLRLRAQCVKRQKEQSSEAKPGGKSKANTIPSIFLILKNGIIAEKL